MFATDDILNATLVSIETKADSWEDVLTFSIPAMGGTKEFKMTRSELYWCEDLKGEMVGRNDVVAGQTYNLEVRRSIFIRLGQ